MWLRKKIIALIPKQIKKKLLHCKAMLLNGYAVKSYSQEGEDIILRRIFSQQKVGFYVDVGAHHPMRFSNTYSFYKLGWRGINVEPNPDNFNMFKKYRANDINLNLGIAKVNGHLNYHMFDESALNTFDSEVLKSRIENSHCEHIATVEVQVKTLADVLAENVSVEQKVDFLTIDVEGFDLEVLQSNDWQKFRPSWVLVEQLNTPDIENLDFEIHHFMKSKEYKLFAKTYNTFFYKNEITST